MSLTKEQEAFRASGMGGTDVAELVLGSPLKVYAKKVERHETVDNLAMLIGRSMEPGLRAIYAAQTGAALLGPELVRHPHHPIAIGSLDDRTDSKVIEFKTANSFVRDQWGEGPDDVPERYLVQCQWYLGIKGLAQADLAVLLGGSDFRIYTLSADPELFGMLLNQAERFWRNHVIPGTPPPVDGSDFAREWLADHYKSDKAAPIEADARAEEMMARYRMARETREAAEETEREARNQLQALIGDAAGMRGNGWSISFKRNKDVSRVDWEALAKAYTPSPTEIAKFTTAKPGPRVFRVSGPKEK